MSARAKNRKQEAQVAVKPPPAPNKNTKPIGVKKGAKGNTPDDQTIANRHLV